MVLDSKTTKDTIKHYADICYHTKDQDHFKIIKERADKCGFITYSMSDLISIDSEDSESEIFNEFWLINLVNLKNKTYMNETFEDILTSTLEVLEQNPDMDINKLVDVQTKKYKTSEEAKATIEDTFACLDKFTELGHSLADARKEGLTRDQWLVQEIERMTEGRTQDEKDAVATAIVESMEQHVESEVEEANLENE